MLMQYQGPAIVEAGDTIAEVAAVTHLTADELVGIVQGIVNADYGVVDE